MKPKLLYIGNQLSRHGYNKTSIETLGVFLADEGYLVTYTSDKRNKILRLLDMLFVMLWNVKRINYVLIDTYSTSSFWYVFICSQLLHFFKIKYIPILRGGNLPKRLIKNPILCKLIFKYAYVNVSPSKYLKEIFENHGFKNVIFIPNSIALEKYPFKRRESIAPKLLWVRAFASIYNPEMAVKVFAKIKSKYPEASLTMVGPDKDGSLLQTRELAKRLGVKVNFTGKLSKEDWWRIAADHDLFINTTHFDNTPVSVMEAMALGLPIVTTNVGGIPFLLKNKETAILVEDNGIDEMVLALVDLIENFNKSTQLIDNARLFVEKLDWQLVKKDWNNLLSQ